MANDVLPYAPSPSLLEEARASMLYAPQSYPLIDSSLCGANVVFGKATALREEERAIVSCPDAVKFYCASETFSIRVVAVMEVHADNNACIIDGYISVVLVLHRLLVMFLVQTRSQNVKHKVVLQQQDMHSKSSSTLRTKFERNTQHTHPI